MSPNAGGGGCGLSVDELSTAVHAHGALINFGDLIPYVTYSERPSAAFAISRNVCLTKSTQSTKVVGFWDPRSLRNTVADRSL
jgi:hypothetical protein